MDSGLTPFGVKRAVIAAVTAWGRSPSGYEATNEYRARYWNFNLGDLAHHVDDPALQQALRQHGITMLRIQTVEGVDGLNWDFDDPLVMFDGNTR